RLGGRGPEEEGRRLCRLHPPLRRAQLRKLSGAAHSGAGSALDPQRHLRPGPGGGVHPVSLQRPAGPAGPAPLQVVLLRLLPPAPAGPGRPAAPDRVTDMGEKNAPDFRPGRSLSKSLAEFRRPQAAEEKSTARFPPRGTAAVAYATNMPPACLLTLRRRKNTCAERASQEPPGTEAQAQRIPFGGKGVSLFRQAHAPDFRPGREQYDRA